MDYVTELCILTADCNFGDENQEIVLQLCVSCHNDKTKMKLLVLPQIDFDEIYAVMQAAVDSVESIHQMRGGEKVGANG